MPKLSPYGVKPVAREHRRGARIANLVGHNVAPDPQSGPSASRSAACRTVAVFSTDTSQSGNGRARRGVLAAQTEMCSKPGVGFPTRSSANTRSGKKDDWITLV